MIMILASGLTNEHVMQFSKARRMRSKQLFLARADYLCISFTCTCFMVSLFFNDLLSSSN